MGVIISSKEQIQNYFNNPAISQSKLKTLIGGLESFLKHQDTSDKDLYYSENPVFIKGSGVDIKLTGNEEDFKEDFYISQLEVKPSDVEMSIIHRIVDKIYQYHDQMNIPTSDIQNLTYYPGFITEAIEEEGWYNGKPGEKRTQGLIERCTSYFEELIASKGKQILTKEENSIIDNTVISFKTNSFTKDYFDKEQQLRNEHVDVYYQLPIYFEYEGRPCKALLDMLIVYKDDANRITSIQPIDIKTMSGNTLNFITNVKRHRYDIQAAWYVLALSSWLQTQQTVENPVIMNFKFLVESVTNIGNPLVYTFDSEMISMGKYGRPELYTNAIGNLSKDLKEHVDFEDGDWNVGTLKSYTINYKEIKGYEQLFQEYEFYEENGTSSDMLIVQNEGNFKLDWNGIVK